MYIIYVFGDVEAMVWTRESNVLLEYNSNKEGRAAFINISSILLLVIAGLWNRRRHYHHISGNVEICLYVFGEKITPKRRRRRTEGDECGGEIIRMLRAGVGY